MWGSIHLLLTEKLCLTCCKGCGNVLKKMLHLVKGLSLKINDQKKYSNVISIIASHGMYHEPIKCLLKTRGNSTYLSYKD